MRGNTVPIAFSILWALLMLAVDGCSAPAKQTHAGRSAAEKELLVKPGQLGGSADGQRWLFDYWNKQVIREDVPVGTVFMGDSITEFWNLPVYFTVHDGIFQNRGIGGDQASVMARRFQADVVQLRPRNVIILAGTNDVSSMLTEKKGEADIIREVTASIEMMMDQSRAAGINTLVCSLLPTNSNFPLHEQGKKILVAINGNIKAACAGKGCIYVDYASPLSDADGDLREDLAYDGVHPSYAGYEVMTRIVNEIAAKHGLRL